MKYFYFFLLVKFVPIYSQEQNFNELALNSFSNYLNSTDLFSENKGDLKFDSYSNSILINLEYVIKDPLSGDNLSVIKKTTKLPLDNIIEIEESIIELNNNSNEKNIEWSIKLAKPIRLTISNKEKNKILNTEVQEQTTYVLSCEQNILSFEIIDIQKLIRDIFSKAKFKPFIEVDFIENLSLMNFKSIDDILIKNDFETTKSIGWTSKENDFETKEFFKIKNDPGNVILIKVKSTKTINFNIIEINTGKNYYLNDFEKELVNKGYTLVGEKNDFKVYEKNGFYFMINEGIKSNKIIYIKD